jgi:hypothetical protein
MTIHGDLFSVSRVGQNPLQELRGLWSRAQDTRRLLLSALTNETVKEHRSNGLGNLSPAPSSSRVRTLGLLTLQTSRAPW